MRITFVVTHAYGMGGTIRTVTNLANSLAGEHDIEILSVVRQRRVPFFGLDPRVSIRAAADVVRLERPGGGPRRRVARLAAGRPSRLMHRRDKAYHSYNLWTDIQLLRAIRATRSDVLVTTRPALSLFAARFADRRMVRVAQEHSFALGYHRELQAEVGRRYPDLDAVVALTPAHAGDLDQLLNGAPVRRAIVPNGIDTTGKPQSTHENRLVIAAGRLAPVKRYDHLVRAFARVVERHPDWRLRIYGKGMPRIERQLRRLINDLELYNHIFLMGQSSSMDREFAKASLTAMSSASEALPMTLLESMACGVPPVSYDCPHGPRSVITDGKDGLLVANGDIKALATGMLTLIEDPERRRVMGQAAVAKAAQYDRSVIASQWDALFRELVARKQAA